ncbi:hypothetical protein IT396_00485 [Candidatus Nomurabacteria bacterium]|nr:hypothetical protein [Candidatus Nomurabacteria bacterium]
MKVTFTYDKEKDIWCLLSKGKSSSNSTVATKPYEQLVAEYGENPTSEDTVAFVGAYLGSENINSEEYAALYQKEWEEISPEFIKRAESIFGVSIPNSITAYLTVNTRCPYSIEKDYFFVSLQNLSTKKTAMHELWHFYTWYGLGADQEEKLGRQKYNDLKEALTVLLNVECKDLLPEGVEDKGYPQHQELRGKILEYWAKDRNMANLWDYLVELG